MKDRITYLNISAVTAKHWYLVEIILKLAQVFFSFRKAFANLVEVPIGWFKNATWYKQLIKSYILICI